MHHAGENGEPVFHDMSEDREAKRQLQQYGFNMVVSDKIAMNRTIPDTRLDEYVLVDTSWVYLLENRLYLMRAF